MANRIPTSYDLYMKLARALDLPSGIIEMSINLLPNQIATISIERVITESDAEAMSRILEEYELHKK